MQITVSGGTETGSEHVSDFISTEFMTVNGFHKARRRNVKVTPVGYILTLEGEAFEFDKWLFKYIADGCKETSLL